MFVDSLCAYLQIPREGGICSLSLSHTHTHIHTHTHTVVYSGSLFLALTAVVSFLRTEFCENLHLVTPQCWLIYPEPCVCVCVCNLCLCGFSPPNCFFQLQGILQRWVLMVCLQSVPVRVPSLVPRPQSPSLATHTLHCHSPQSDLRSFLPVRVRAHTLSCCTLQLYVWEPERVCGLI